jgi:hypothetical protein
MPTRGWFKYIETATDPFDPVNYLYSSNFPTVCTTNGTQICSVLSVYDTGVSTHPVLSDNLSSYITDALSSGSPKPSLGTKYVYVRPS